MCVEGFGSREMDCLEQQIIIKFCPETGKLETETLQMFRMGMTNNVLVQGI
jgi:hypothetical protein